MKSVAENDATGMTVRVIYRRDRYLRGGDHIGFLEQGYPAARFTEPDEDFAHQHQNVRVENGVQFGDLPRVLRLPVHRPRRARERRRAVVTGDGAGHPEGREDPHGGADERLGTAVGRDAGRFGYEVVWRETTAPDWTHAIDVGPALTAKIDLSKDNVFFAVRAVGPDGRRSPAAFPAPVS